MSVQVHWFTEQPYSFTTEDVLAEHQDESYFTLSNRFFDPMKAHQLYNEYHEQ